MDWMPIETAPKDVMNRFLACDARALLYRPELVRWDGACYWMCGCDTEVIAYPSDWFTHWMPMPPPPTPPTSPAPTRPASRE